MSTPLPPEWPYCAHGANPATDPTGCRGNHVPGHTACLAHLADADRNAYLASLTPGADIDHRGTTFTEPLLNDLLNALRDPVTGKARIGVANLEWAVFEGHAEFGAATFEGAAMFRSAIFKGDAGFEPATFEGDVRFNSAVFEGDAKFWSVTFKGDAVFRSATFKGDAGFALATFTSGALFPSAVFEGDAWFDSALFQEYTGFNSATFEGAAMFESATFEGAARFRSATLKGDAKFWSVTFKGTAEFESATFEGDAWFRSATFEGAAVFESATFAGDATFESATFEGNAMFWAANFKLEVTFESAVFGEVARFDCAVFESDAEFWPVTFQCDATFISTVFEGSALFRSANFEGAAVFESATFAGDATFESAIFVQADSFGPFVCAGRVVLSSARFDSPVTLSCAARRLECRRTRWSSTAEIRLRYTSVDFAHAVFEYPLTIAAEQDPFRGTGGRPLAEGLMPSASGPGVRVVSLHGVDAAHLVLADLDLTECLFTGTVHLDQLRLDGACTFDTAPSGVRWRGRLPVHFTARHVLAEEHHWRAGQSGVAQGWKAAGPGVRRAGPLQLAPVYRALRKAYEDSKHEPGAADFYYGEMEMRRHSEAIPRGEKWLLNAYWALSGYGLRASRALAWLGLAMLLTIILMMAFGIAQDDPKQTATGTVPAGGGKVTFEIDKDDPQNPSGDRFTGERFEKAVNVTLNSVVFRSSGQDLTTAGTYIEMASRVSEPVLLGLGILAIRNRVKR